MADVNVRSDSVDVEQIMRQIRARVREKRGADYTEAELQQLAKVKLEKFLDPKGVRSDLLEQFRSQRTMSPSPPNFEFGEDTLYETHRGGLAALRRLLRPLLKLFFNPDRLTTTLHVQSQLNAHVDQQLKHLPLWFELLHNLTVEITRLGIEVQNLTMRVESLSSRVDFDERRARSLESVVQYRQAPPRQTHPEPGPAAAAAPQPHAAPSTSTRPAQPTTPGSETPGGEPRRRRRRRRRRRPGQTMADGSQADWQNRNQGAPDGDGNRQDTPGGSSDSDAAESSDGPFEADGPDGPDDSEQ
jgi:hypothetical protein